MSYDVDTKEKIHYIQNAIWKLAAAVDLIETTNGPRDPEIDEINKIIARLNAELDILYQQNG